MSDRHTRAWQLYERGRDYNNRLVPNQYNLVTTNIEFFAGNQWLNIPQTPAMARLPKPVFNIIKRVTSLFVASLTSSAASISFERLSDYGGSPPGPDEAALATAEVQNLLEKLKMDYRIREALFDGAQTGDYCAHFYWDADARPYGGALGPWRGEIAMELVDGINVMFGNPNTPQVERQPYILIVGRDTTDHLREEMERHGGGGELAPDGETGGQPGRGGQTELESDGEEGKALYLYLYEKKRRADGSVTVHVSKATRSCVIYEDVDTGLSRYPIAWGNWEKQKNQSHGRALVTGIIPNQIFINTMFAMAMRHLQLMGFPKTVYNADLISQWSNEVGQAIGVRGLRPDQPISQVAATLQPADMSHQIIQAIDKAVAYTKDCLGATDAQLGNVKPDNTSALMVLQSSAEVPLENTRAGLYEWLEDVGGILLDMMGTYYGKRPMVHWREFTDIAPHPATGQPQVDGETGLLVTRTARRRVVEEYDFSAFKNLWFHVRVNAGATNYYSEIAMVQTLDNLRREGILDAAAYLERIPDKLIPRKSELVEELRTAAGAPTPTGKGGGAVVGGAISADKALSTLPQSIQRRRASLPKSAQRAIDQLATLKGGSL